MRRAFAGMKTQAFYKRVFMDQTLYRSVFHEMV